MQQDAKSQKSSSISDFEFLNQLGKGSFGTVYKVRRKVDKNIYVMKQINISQLNSAFKASALNEVKILSSLENPYVVKYFDSFIEKNLLNIVMEYCEGGDLTNYIRGQLGRPLPETKIWKFFIQMCIGLGYIHSKKILHRDIKSMNIFLSKDEEIRIGDLGVAKAMAESANFAHTMVGTPYYLSPEMCEEKPYNEKSDIWALGCVLYEMCTQKHPFEANNQAALLLKILRGKFNPISNGYSPDLVEIVDNCLTKDYRKRPSTQDLLNKPSLMNRAKGLNINLSIDAKANNHGQDAQKGANKSQPSQDVAKTDKNKEGQSKDNKIVSPTDKSDKGNPKAVPVSNNFMNNNNAEIKQVKNEPQKIVSAKDIARPAAHDPARGVNDLKAAPKKVDLVNNNLYKVHSENKNPANVVNPKDKAVKAPPGNAVEKVVKKDQPLSKPKEVINKPKDVKDRVSENIAKAKIPEKPQKPIINNEPQQKLVAKIKADTPAISRPRLLEDKEKPPAVRDHAVSHKKHVSDVKITEEELNQVKGLPDKVFPTPGKNPSKDKISALFGKNIDFFSNKKTDSKPDLLNKIPSKIDASNRSKSSKQEVINDDFIRKEFPDYIEDKKVNYKSVSEEKKNQEPFRANYQSNRNPERQDSEDEDPTNYTGTKTSEEYRSPTKGEGVEDIPVTMVEKEIGNFQVTDINNGNEEDEDYEYNNSEERSEDEAYDSQNDDNENIPYDNEEEKKEDDSNEESDEKNEDNHSHENSMERQERIEEEKENLKLKLEQAAKKKDNLEQMIKERTAHFISKWGQKAFDELSIFFRQKIGDENTEKTEAEIEEFLGQKLKGEVQPEQVFYIVSRILPLEHNLEKVKISINKYSEELE